MYIAIIGPLCLSSRLRVRWVGVGPILYVPVVTATLVLCHRVGKPSTRSRPGGRGVHTVHTKVVFGVSLAAGSGGSD